MIFFIFHMNNSSHEYMLVKEIGNINKDTSIYCHESRLHRDARRTEPRQVGINEAIEARNK